MILQAAGKASDRRLHEYLALIVSRLGGEGTPMIIV